MLLSVPSISFKLKSLVPLLCTVICDVIIHGKIPEQIPFLNYDQTIMYCFYILFFCDKYHVLLSNLFLVGGALNLRKHWDHYVAGTQVLIYIIDSSNLDTVNVAKVELLSLVESNKHLETIPWLIIASKQVRWSLTCLLKHFLIIGYFLN